MDSSSLNSSPITLASVATKLFKALDLRQEDGERGPDIILC